MSGETRYPDSPNSNSISEGLEFQDFVMEILADRLGLILQNYCSAKYQLSKGENRQGFEIKLDNRCTETGRLSIEIAEKTAIAKDWVPSGIYSGKHWIYVQGNFECFWIFLSKFLRKLHRCGKNYEEKEEPTIKAFYLPIEDADKYGHKVIIEQF